MIFSILTLFILNFIIFLLGFFGNLDRNKAIVSIFLQLFLFSICMGFRDFTIGIDTAAYISSYLNSSIFKEPVFFGLERLISFLGFPSRIYVLILSMIMGSIAFLIFTNDLPIKKQLLPIIIWIFLSNAMVILSWINILRQGLASFIILYSITFISKKNYIKGFFLLILAASIHFSAIMFLFFFVSYIFSFKNSLFRVFFSNKILIDFVIMIFSFLLGFIISKIPFVAERYPGMGSKLLIVKIFFAILYYFILKYVLLNNKSEKVLVWFYIYFYIICLSLIFYFTGEISNRFLYFSGCFEAILLGITLTYRKIEKRSFLTSLVIFNFCYFYLIVNSPAFAYNFNYINFSNIL